MIRHPKDRPHPPGFLVKPGMTFFLTPDSRQSQELVFHAIHKNQHILKTRFVALKRKILAKMSLT